MKLEDAIVTVHPKTGAWQFHERGTVPERHIRFERRPVADGETFTHPSSGEMPFPSNLKQKIVGVYVGFGENGANVERLMLHEATDFPRETMDFEAPNAA